MNWNPALPAINSAPHYSPKTLHDSTTENNFQQLGQKLEEADYPHEVVEIVPANSLYWDHMENSISPIVCEADTGTPCS